MHFHLINNLNSETFLITLQPKLKAFKNIGLQNQSNFSSRKRKISWMKYIYKYFYDHLVERINKIKNIIQRYSL